MSLNYIWKSIPIFSDQGAGSSQKYLNIKIEGISCENAKE